jgi:hypothetical protein
MSPTPALRRPALYILIHDMGLSGKISECEMYGWGLEVQMWRDMAAPSGKLLEPVKQPVVV